VKKGATLTSLYHACVDHNAVVSQPGPGRERIVDVARWRGRSSNFG